MSHHSAKLEPHRLNGERTMSELKKSPLRCADDTQGEAQAQRLVRRSGALAVLVAVTGSALTEAQVTILLCSGLG
jgi:hypothetical protein